MKSLLTAVAAGTAIGVAVVVVAVLAMPFMPERMLEIFIDTPA